VSSSDKVFVVVGRYMSFFTMVFFLAPTPLINVCSYAWFFFHLFLFGRGGGFGGASIFTLLLIDLADTFTALRAAYIFGLLPRTIFLIFSNNNDVWLEEL
jgi:hypothetical protein